MLCWPALQCGRPGFDSQLERKTGHRDRCGRLGFLQGFGRVYLSTSLLWTQSALFPTGWGPGVPGWDFVNPASWRPPTLEARAAARAEAGAFRSWGHASGIRSGCHRPRAGGGQGGEGAPRGGGAGAGSEERRRAGRGSLGAGAAGPGVRASRGRGARQGPGRRGGRRAPSSTWEVAAMRAGLPGGETKRWPKTRTGPASPRSAPACPGAGKRSSPVPPWGGAGALGGRSPATQEPAGRAAPPRQPCGPQRPASGDSPGRGPSARTPEGGSRRTCLPAGRRGERRPEPRTGRVGRGSARGRLRDACLARVPRDLAGGGVPPSPGRGCVTPPSGLGRPRVCRALPPVRQVRCRGPPLSGVGGTPSVGQLCPNLLCDLGDYPLEVSSSLSLHIYQMERIIFHPTGCVAGGRGCGRRMRCLMNFTYQSSVQIPINYITSDMEEH